MICSPAISPPERLQWTRILCSPRTNTRSERWPTSSWLLERKALMSESLPPQSADPDVPPVQIPTTSLNLPSRVSSRIPSTVPPQGSFAAEEIKVTSSKMRASAITNSELMPPTDSTVVFASRSVTRRMPNGQTLILKPLAKRPLDNASSSMPAAKDPVKKHRKLLVKFVAFSFVFQPFIHLFSCFPMSLFSCFSDYRG